ncbi:MAG: hypothetical protein WBL65_06765 [Bryobacteraceae bacterium]
MQARFTAVMAAAAMLSIFAGVGWGQAAAQPKPLVNADIVKMVKAGLAENTIVLAIQNKPSSFDTSPEELIRLKEQGVSQVVLNAMLNASNPAPAAPAPAQSEPPPAAQQTQSSQSPAGVWVEFYGVCRRGDLTIFKPTIYANQTELARLACNTYFYVAAVPGTYKFCATKGKCVTAAIGSNGPYYFRILPTAISYNIAQVDSSVAQDEIQDHGAAALDLSRVLAPKMVTVNTDVSPPEFVPQQ